MKLLTEMIAIRGVGPATGYYMKVVYCTKCGAEHTMSFLEPVPRCKACRKIMRVKWLEIDKPEYTEHKANYHKKRRDTPDAGKNPRKFF